MAYTVSTSKSASASASASSSSFSSSFALAFAPSSSFASASFAPEAPPEPGSGTYLCGVVDVSRDPFGPPPSADDALSTDEGLASEVAWFDAPARLTSRPRRALTLPPAAPIDDPVADRWFR